MRNWALTIYPVFCMLVHADTVTTSTATLEAFPNLASVNDPFQGQNGTLAFWANHSLDGLTDPNNVNSPLRPNSQLNVGNFLTGTCGPNASSAGSCPAGTFDGMATPNLDPNSLSFVGNGLNAVSSFYFTRDGSNDFIDPMLAYSANTQQFGWYVAGDPNSLNPIFSGLTQHQTLPSEWSLANIPLGTSYGFYVTVNYGSGYLATYYTESQFNSFTPTASFASLLGTDSVSGASKQHFALFEDGSSYFLGLTGARGNAGYEGMGDYQDVVVGISLAASALSIPEPATFGLIIVAVAGVVALKRRRRAR